MGECKHGHWTEPNCPDCGAHAERLATLSARVVEAAVEVSLYERMPHAKRLVRYVSRYSVAESDRRREALDAAIDALIAERDGQ